MITVERPLFQRALELATAAIDRRSTIPICTMVKVLANGALSLQGTDLDITTKAEIPYSGDEAEFCLPEPRAVRSSIGTVGSKTVCLENSVAEKQITLIAGPMTAHLRGGRDADDHPGAESIAEQDFAAELGVDALRQIQRITKAISTEQTRYYLNGICVWRVGDWLYRFAAADGHRLMMVDIPLPGATGDLPDQAILPKRWIMLALQHFAKAREAITLTFGRVAVRNTPAADLALMPHRRVALAAQLAGVDFTLTSKLIDGIYPDVSRVIPKQVDHVVRVDRAELVRAVQSLLSLASKNVRAVRFTPCGVSALRCMICCPAFGDSGMDIPAGFAGLPIPADFTIAMNGRYLLDICEALNGDEVSLGFSDASSPVLITDPADTAFQAVLMPMRV